MKDNLKSEWTGEMNDRRCDLIDKAIDETITSEEAQELKGLEERLNGYMKQRGLLLVDEARALHNSLGIGT